MIPIQFTLKDEQYRTKITSTFYKEIIKGCLQDRIISIDNWCKQNLVINERVYSFKDVVVASLPELIEIKTFIDHKKIPMDFFYFINSKGNKLCYIVDNLYETKVPRFFLVESLGMSVCPYCNRNFINSASNRTFCQLDHFINKSSYPIFSVSFYNLIPVCSNCNHVKGAHDFDWFPHDLSVSINDYIQFSYHILDYKYLYDHTKIRIDIDCSNRIRSNVEALKLHDLYQIHTNLVQELIKKAYIYNENYLEDIFGNSDGLFGSKDELYRVVFGNYLNDLDFHKRPLSKLTYDICKEMGI